MGVVKHTAKLIIEIAEAQCRFERRIVNGVPWFKVHFRARSMWDGLCEKWLFFVHPTGKEIKTELDEQDSFCVEHVLDDAFDVHSMEADVED
jgi:hypothetical protein